jgi:hypothetical protein
MKKYILRRLGVAHDPGRAKPTLQGCLEAVLEQSDALMDDILEGLQASVAPKKDRNVLPQKSPLGTEAVEVFCAQRTAVKVTFAKALRSAIYGGNKQRLSAQPLVRFDDFQFLEQEQIDANIEFALTQQEVMLAVESVMPTLNALVSNLLGLVSVHAHLNPLKPESFVFALRETLAEHLPKEALRASVITPAAGLLGIHLCSLYKDVADWLRSQGIEAAGPIGPSSNQHGVKVKAPENAVTRTLLTLDKLRKLLSGELEMAQQAGSAGDFMHTVPASYVALEDMQLIEPMMKRLTERAKQSVARNPEALVSTEAAKGILREQAQRKNLGHQLGEEVLRLMLENLMQDRRLLASVRKSLSAMEPFLLKLSQSDARFFSDRQHPARQFLDKMTHRSLAFSSQDEPGFTIFHQVFERCIAEISASECDAAAFAKVLGKLEENWACAEQDQRQRAEEAARGLLHAEQRNLLAQKMVDDFNARMENKVIPDMVATFLRGPWAQVVAESQLRCVDGTVDADGYLTLVDDLIWSVCLRLARKNRARLVQMVPGMLVKMRHGLSLISYPEERSAVFFDELITFHEKAFEGARLPASSDDTPITAQQETALRTVALPPDEFWMTQDEAQDSGYFTANVMPPPDDIEDPDAPEPIDLQLWSIDKLSTGAWVDLAFAGQWVRAQLTWASPHKTLFMFISAGGLAHSMSRRTMDRLRGFGLIRLVSNGRIMDSALDAVAQAALQNDLEKPQAER